MREDTHFLKSIKVESTAAPAEEIDEVKLGEVQAEARGMPGIKDIDV